MPISELDSVPGRHVFHPQLHHPIVAVAQHVTSPLTGSLLIFAIHKAWQAPAAAASLRATAALWRVHEWTTVPRFATGRAAAFIAATAAAAVAWAAAPKAALTPSAAALAALYGERDAHHVARALSAAPTVVAAGKGLRLLRESSGAPWWLTIVGATLALRCALVPLNVALLRNSLRMKLIMPDVLRLGGLLSSDAPAGARAAAARELRTLFETSRASPWAQSFVFPLALPIAVLSIFGAVHDLCLIGEGMETGGTLWFRDLMVADETQLLPIASGLSWLVNVEMGAGAYYAALPIVRLSARLGAVATIPLAATLPSGVLLFWITSNVFAVARGFAMRSNRVRRAFGVPLQAQIDAIKSTLPRAIHI